MSTESKALTIVPRTLPEMQSMAEVLAKSSLLPEALRNKVPDVVVQIMTGQELGLSPMASIRGVHIVQGKPVLAADTMMGLVLSSGLAEYFSCLEASATSVTFATKRKGSPHEQKCTWTMDDAKRAGLNAKDNWRLHPRQMLASRAKAELARLVYPDVLAGCYDPDELSVPVRDAPLAVVREPDATDAEIVSETPSVLTAIRDAATVADLEALMPTLRALPEADKQSARGAYNDRKAALTAQGAA